MLPIVPSRNTKPHSTPCFQRLRTKQDTQAGDIPGSGHFWANSLFELVGKLFLTMATSHCPTRLRVQRHSSLSRVRNWQQDRCQHGEYVHRTCFESYTGKHLW